MCPMAGKVCQQRHGTLLYGQLQNALKMQASVMSGAQTYQELCVAALNEEKRLAELRKQQQYLHPLSKKPAETKPPSRFSATHFPTRSSNPQLETGNC